MLDFVSYDFKNLNIILGKFNNILRDKNNYINFKNLSEKEKKILSEKESVSIELSAYADREWTPNLLQIVKDLNYNRSRKIEIDTNIAKLDISIEELKKILKLDDKAFKFFSFMLDKMTERYIQSFEKSLNEIYYFVYRDESKQIRLDSTESRGKKVLKLKICSIVDGKTYEEDIQDSGHSVSVVLGSVLLVYYIVYCKLPRILFFDETFSGLSTLTISRFFQLLQNFSKDLGFKFLIISHDPRIVNFMDRIYLVKDGVYSLVKENLDDEVQSFLEDLADGSTEGFSVSDSNTVGG